MTPVLLSNRLPPALEPNRLATRLQDLRTRGEPVIDLTETNPTKVGIAYPEGLLSTLARREGLSYVPVPLGLDTARHAVAGEYARRGVYVDPDCVVLTASTSEAYSWLFKAVCDPGTRVLVPRPSYPLFEHLARLEGVRLGTYDSAYHGRWDVDTGALVSAGDDVRAVVAVSPNNPTGSCLSVADAEILQQICGERGWLLITDEVFADYLLEATGCARDLAVRSSCLAVSLGGLSKSVGLPQIKAAWMVFGGPDAARLPLLAGIELIADTFLSVSTPTQLALPILLQEGRVVREAILSRLRANLSILREVSARFPQCDVPLVEGGWSAVIRVPATSSEESLVLDILERERILIHPGYFFDFRHEAYLVLSLLVDPDLLRKALPRVLRVATT